MKILIILMLAAWPAGAAEWGGAEAASARGLVTARAEIAVLDRVPLLELLAARDKASQELTIGGQKFLATVVFDSDWDSWFTLKPAGGGLGAGAWKETSLAAGAVYKYGGAELRLKETEGVVTIEAADGAHASVPVAGLFDLLYAGSYKITFGDAVTYAVFRNLEPLSEREGTAALRLASDGRYYYSLTPDRQIEAAPGWLLAVNGVLYGLLLDGAELSFVAKPIGEYKPPLRAERAR